MIRYQGITQYEKDMLKRRRLEYELNRARLKTTLPGTAGLLARRSIAAIIKQLRALPTKNDIVCFNIMLSPPFSNKPYRSSSSWVKNCIYNPKSNTVSMSLGKKSYLYNISLPILKNMLKYRSIGQYYNTHLKGTI